MLLNTFWIALLLLCLQFPTFAQQDVRLSGVIVLQNSGYEKGEVEYIAGVNIRSIKATPTVSDANGRFTLVFSDVYPGTRVMIDARDEAYDVVNIKELRNAAILGRTKPLKIIMCPKGKIHENRLSYYNIAEDAIIENYKAKIAILEEESQEQKALLAEMTVEFKREIRSISDAKALLDQQLTALTLRAKEIADKFVRINLDDKSETYRSAFSAFKKGDIQGAISILDEIDLQERLATNARERAREQSVLDEMQRNALKELEKVQLNIQAYLLKEGASLQTSPSETFNNFDFTQDSSFMYSLLTFITQIPEDDDKIKHELIALLEASIGAYTELVSIMSFQFENDLALCYESVGKLYIQTNHYQEAIHSFDFALEIYLELINNYFPGNEYKATLSANYLAQSYQLNNQKSLSLEYYEYALELSNKIKDLTLREQAQNLINYTRRVGDND